MECSCVRRVRSDTDGVSLEVEVVVLLGMGHHPLTYQLNSETLAAYQAQVPIHPDMIVCRFVVTHKQQTKWANGFGVHTGFLVATDGVLCMEPKEPQHHSATSVSSKGIEGVLLVVDEDPSNIFIEGRIYHPPQVTVQWY